jgi:hypothetical protein
MIQLNLLPDVKMEYIKAQRSRRLVTTVSVLASVGAIVLLGGLLSVGALQKKHINDVNKDIVSSRKNLEKKPQINKILTVQNQLESLPGLHSTKPSASRMFEYLNSVTPSDISLGSLDIDFINYEINITGSAPSLAGVNKYIDTLKFTTFTSEESSAEAPSAESSPGDKLPAFSNVVLTGFSLGTDTQQSSKATYIITLSYDPLIFDITKTVKLSVPNRITTRSAISQPTELFQAASPPTATSTGGQ